MSLGYFLPPTYVIVLAVSLALHVAWTPQSPLADSLALSGVRRFGSSYPAMRIWGSIAFLCANLVGGVMLAIDRPECRARHHHLRPGLHARRVAVAPRLGRPRRASPLSATDIQEAAPRLLNRYFLLFVAGVGIINASHGFLYGFVSIYWKSIGINDAVIGFLWAFAVVAEVGMFMMFTRVFALAVGDRRAVRSRVPRPCCAGRLSADLAARARRRRLLRRPELHALSTGAVPDRPAEADRRDRRRKSARARRRASPSSPTALRWRR